MFLLFKGLCKVINYCGKGQRSHRSRSKVTWVEVKGHIGRDKSNLDEKNNASKAMVG